MQKLNFRILIVLVLGITFLFFSSCTKLSYLEAEVYSCCNIWDDLEDVLESDSVEDKVKAYLDQNEIRYYNVEVVKVGEPEVCVTCCECSSGQKVIIEIDEQEEEAAGDLGFE